MDLSRPVVVQRHSYLPICPIWACPWAKNLSNEAALGSDFAEPISLKPLDGLYSETTWAVGIAQLTHHEVQGGGKNPETGGRGIFAPTANRVVS